MEKRTLRVIFNKSGGNASKNSFTTRITVPKSWLDDMGVTQDNREIVATFDGRAVTIRKGDIMQENILEALERGYRDAYYDYTTNGGAELYNYYRGYSRAFETALKAIGYTPGQAEGKCIAINAEIEEGKL